jgi:hypothetical protein
MAFNIDELLSQNPYGFTKPSYFAAAIQTPPSFWGGDLRFLSYLCSAAAFPSVQILTQDAKTTGYGVTQKIPYDVLHSDLTLTFYCDAKGQVVTFFDRWMRNVVSFGPIGYPVSGANQGDVQYPSAYQTVLQLFQYIETDAQTPLLVYNMDNCYPISVSEVSVDWSNGNAIETIQVTFAYRNFWLQQNVISNAGLSEDSGYYAGMAGGILPRLTPGEAMGITSGIMGLPGFGKVLGAFSKGEIAIQSAINTLGGLGVSINSQLLQVDTFGSQLGFLF